jgi:hypothetical protein
MLSFKTPQLLRSFSFIKGENWPLLRRELMSDAIQNSMKGVRLLLVRLSLCEGRVDAVCD